MRNRKSSQNQSIQLNYKLNQFQLNQPSTSRNLNNKTSKIDFKEQKSFTLNQDLDRSTGNVQSQQFEQLQFSVIPHTHRQTMHIPKQRTSDHLISSHQQKKLPDSSIRKVNLNLNSSIHFQQQQQQQQYLSQTPISSMIMYTDRSDSQQNNFSQMYHSHREVSYSLALGEILNERNQPKFTIEKYENIIDLVKHENTQVPSKLKVALSSLHDKQLSQLKDSTQFKQLIGSFEQQKLNNFLEQTIKSNVSQDDFTQQMILNQIGQAPYTRSRQQSYGGLQQLKLNSQSRQATDLSQKTVKQQKQQTWEYGFEEQFFGLNMDKRYEQLQEKYMKQNDEYLQLLKIQEFKDSCLRDYEKSIKQMDEMRVVLNEFKKQNTKGQKGQVTKNLIEKMSIIVMNQNKNDHITEKDLLLLKYLDGNNDSIQSQDFMKEKINEMYKKHHSYNSSIMNNNPANISILEDDSIKNMV
eukprot:403345554